MKIEIKRLTSDLTDLLKRKPEVVDGGIHFVVKTKVCTIKISKNLEVLRFSKKVLKTENFISSKTFEDIGEHSNRACAITFLGAKASEIVTNKGSVITISRGDGNVTLSDKSVGHDLFFKVTSGGSNAFIHFKNADEIFWKER